MVYDLRNRKLVKKCFFYMQDLLKSFNIISKLQAEDLKASGFILNPYKNTLNLSLNLKESISVLALKSIKQKDKGYLIKGLMFLVSLILETE